MALNCGEFWSVREAFSKEGTWIGSRGMREGRVGGIGVKLLCCVDARDERPGAGGAVASVGAPDPSTADECSTGGLEVEVLALPTPARERVSS